MGEWSRMRWLVALFALASCERLLNFDKVGPGADAADAFVLADGTWAAAANGDQHACAIRDDGTLLCWGNNAHGQLGLGTTASDVSAPAVVGADHWSAISASLSSTCGLHTDQTLWCWGETYGGSLPIDVSTPAQIAGTWRAVAVGPFHTCAIDGTGTMQCWGLGGEGELGVGVAASSPTPAPVQSALHWKAVTSADLHSCGIADDGTAWCWGANYAGQIGDGTNTSAMAPTQVDGETWSVIAAGGSHTCGVRTDGKLRCWGTNGNGELGVVLPPGGGYAIAPVAISDDLGPWAGVFAGKSHTCGITAAGDLYCWGSNASGELGNPEAGPQQPHPLPVTTQTKTWASASLGADATCAIGNDHNMWCFGATRLGTGASLGTPTQLAGMWSAVAAGGSTTCAIDNTGVLYCWGDNSSGQIGDSTYTDHSSPQMIAGTAWSSIGVAPAISCGVAAGGTASCWGTRQSAIGDGSTTRLVPAPIPGGPWSSLAVASAFSCGIVNGNLMCWGTDYFGECTTDPAMPYPQMPTMSTYSPGGWTAVTASGTHACGIANGNAMCWGYNYNGELGDGTSGNTSPHPAPVLVSGLGPVDSIVVGSDHSCAIETGTARCWGFNLYGQVGDGTFVDRSTPVILDGTWKQLAASDANTCGIQTDGSLWCWGSNLHAQLGTGDLMSKYAPNMIGGDHDWAYVTSAVDHTCALKTDQSLWCWGDNSHGQLGLGTSTFAMPQLVP